MLTHTTVPANAMNGRRTYRLRIGLVIVAALLGTTTCGSTDDAPLDGQGSAANNADGGNQPGADGTLVVGVGVEPSTLDPSGGSTPEVNITINIFDTLVTRDNEPELAQSWTVSEDGLTWTFELQEGVEFHNGEPFNADAVKYSLERIQDPDYTTGYKSYWTMVDKVVPVDEYTVEFQLTEPNPFVVDSMHYHLPIVPPKYTEEVGNEGLAQEPIGTGPYKFVEWRHGQSITLEANKDYYLGAPAIQNAEIRFITDESARAAALLSGEVDVVGPLSYDQVDQVENADGVRVETTPSLKQDRLAFREDHDLFDDVRVRKAVTMAIDREAITNTVLRGLAEPMIGPITSTATGFDPDLEPLPYDPEQARELLAEAGYPDGFSVDFDIRPGLMPKDDETPVAIAAMLSEVGIEVNITTYDIGTFLEHTADGTIADLHMNFWAGGGVGHAYQPLRALYSCENGSQVHNPGYYCDPDVDAAAQEAADALVVGDEDSALEAYSRAQQAAIDSAMGAYLWEYSDVWGVKDGVEYPLNEVGDYDIYHSSFTS